MNRRSFLDSMLKAAAACAVLPAATTYARAWKPASDFYVKRSGIYIVNPEWRDAVWQEWLYFDTSATRAVIAAQTPADFENNHCTIKVDKVIDGRRVEGYLIEPFPRRFVLENGVFREAKPIIEV